MINNIKEKEELEEGPEENVHLDSLKATLKKIPNQKRLSQNTVNEFSIRKIHVHPRQIGSAFEWIPARINYIRMDDEKENYPDPEGSHQMDHSLQLLSNNVFKYNKERQEKISIIRLYTTNDLRKKKKVKETRMDGYGPTNVDKRVFENIQSIV